MLTSDQGAREKSATPIQLKAQWAERIKPVAWSRRILRVFILGALVILSLNGLGALLRGL